MLLGAEATGVVHHWNSLDQEFKHIQNLADLLAEMPLFHGDFWESTLPQILQTHKKGSSYNILTTIRAELKKYKDHFLVATLAGPTQMSTSQKVWNSSYFTSSIQHLVSSI